MHLDPDPSCFNLDPDPSSFTVGLGTYCTLWSKILYNPNGLFCFRCNRSNFTDDGKGRRSLAQHLRHCKAPNNCKSNFTKWHNSGTDPFPFLLKKRRIDQSAFNYAHQQDHCLEGETAVSDNFFVGDADHDFSQGSVEFSYVYEDKSPPLVINNIIDLSLVPTVNSGSPYNRNTPLPPSYHFKSNYR